MRKRKKIVERGDQRHGAHVEDAGKGSITFDKWMMLDVTQHLDWIMLAPIFHCRLMHDGDTALQLCIVCTRHDVAMIAKVSGPTTAFIQDLLVSLFGLRIAAHSSLQEVFEPWQRAAMLCQSSLQLECERASLATEGECEA